MLTPPAQTASPAPRYACVSRAHGHHPMTPATPLLTATTMSDTPACLPGAVRTQASAWPAITARSAAARLALAVSALAPLASAAAPPALPPSQPLPLLTDQPPVAWQHCARIANQADRLLCFDTWAQQQQPHVPPPGGAWAHSEAVTPDKVVTPPQAQIQSQTEAALPRQAISTNGGCRDLRYSPLSRLFELEPGSDCGTFSLRGYRPMTIALSTASRINQAPSSPSQATYTPLGHYQHAELRIQLSARTKLASGLLTPQGGPRKDSLWFGYTQQSYWQVFNAGLSRPFRTTDHEPELFYIYPTELALPGGWRWRYSGIGLAHQSNGQSDPLSRSWNRWYLMAGAELDDRWRLQTRLWKRIRESHGSDNNPDLQHYIGRGEVQLFWHGTHAHTLGFTLRGTPGKGRGAARLEWLRALGDGWNGSRSNLHLHVQLSSGYGDSLLDYNFKRTSLSIGLSLLDF